MNNNTNLDYATLIPEVHTFFNSLRENYTKGDYSAYPGSWLATVYFDMDYGQIGNLIAGLRPAFLSINEIKVGEISTDNYMEDVLEAIMIPILVGYGVYEITGNGCQMKNIARLEVVERIIALAQDKCDESEALQMSEYIAPTAQTATTFSNSIRVETRGTYPTSAISLDAYDENGFSCLRFNKSTETPVFVLGFEPAQLQELTDFLSNLPRQLPKG